MSQATIDRVLAQADEIIITAMNEQVLAGLAVGIVHAGQLVYAKGFGLADLSTQRPVTPATVFRIGSISKTFTAVGLMQLYEQGRFQLDDPVNDYLKSFQIKQPPGAAPVSFRHILTHTAGIGELRRFGDLFRPVIGLGVPPGKPTPSPREYYAGGLTASGSPGTRWAYANHAFNVLGQLIEDISGQPFFAYMREQVFGLLGMHHTDYERNERVQDELAVGYQRRRGRLQPVKYFDIAVPGAGSIFSSLDDMARYVAALLNGGRTEQAALLKPETLDLMLTPHYRLDEHLPAMGLAFMLEPMDGYRLAGHDGGWAGFISSMLLTPGHDLGVLVFTNTSDPLPGRLAHDLLRRLLDVPDPVAQLPRSDVLETPQLWPELCGSYGPPPGLNRNARIWLGFGGEIEVVIKDNHPALRSLAGPLWKGARLYPVDRDDPLVFQFVHDKQAQTAVFKRNQLGQIDRLCLGFDTFYKRPRAQSVRFRLLASAGGLTGLTLAALGWQRRRDMKHL